MKIKSDSFLQFFRQNKNKYNVIFLYGHNDGLVDLLFRDTIKILEVDENDPFLVSKIDANELKENPTILNDNLSTISMFGEKRFILLNLLYSTLSKNIEKIILDNINGDNNDYYLIVKAGALSLKNTLIQFLQSSNNSILVACYDEDRNNVRSKLYNLFNKYNLVFSNEFMLNFLNKFSPNSLVNANEFEKLENLLLNNKNISESELLYFIKDNENISFDIIINLCASGNLKKSLFYFDSLYDKTYPNLGIVRQFGNHFKMIERIILLNKKGLSIEDAINKIKPPIFFKNKPSIALQCRLWSIKKVNKILKMLIKLEVKCKTSVYAEKILISQFILSASVLANK